MEAACHACMHTCRAGSRPPSRPSRAGVPDWAAAGRGQEGGSGLGVLTVCSAWGRGRLGIRRQSDQRAGCCNLGSLQAVRMPAGSLQCTHGTGANTGMHACLPWPMCWPLTVCAPTHSPGLAKLEGDVVSARGARLGWRVGHPHYLASDCSNGGSAYLQTACARPGKLYRQRLQGLASFTSCPLASGLLYTLMLSRSTGLPAVAEAGACWWCCSLAA